MTLEITAEQYTEIQNEIIKLEDDIRDNRDKYDGWEISWIDTEIECLKGILKSEKIDLGDLLH